MEGRVYKTKPIQIRIIMEKGVHRSVHCLAASRKQTLGRRKEYIGVSAGRHNLANKTMGQEGVLGSFYRKQQSRNRH